MSELALRRDEIATSDTLTLEGVEFRIPALVAELSESTYHAAPGVSNSQLKEFRRSPAHFRATIGKDSRTAAKAFGRLLHMAALEPERLAESIAVEPRIDRRTKVGKAEAAKFAEENAGKEIVSAWDAAMLHGIGRSLAEHGAARELIRATGLHEVSAFCRHEETGLLLRSRFDIMPHESDILADLKSTEDASREAFAKSIHDFRYYVQAPFYLDNATRCGRERSRFIFIACEKEPPYAVAVWELDAESIEIGREEYQAQLKLFAECVEFDSWPAYSSRIESISLPAWKIAKRAKQLAA
jgi:hypothetical protein